MTPQRSLTKDPLFVGVTRPPMRWGVTYAALLVNLVVTLELTVLSFLGALVLGTVLGVFRVSPVLPLRAFGAAYVGVVGRKWARCISPVSAPCSAL